MDCRFKLLSFQEFQENCPKQCSLVKNRKQKDKLTKENLMAILATGHTSVIPLRGGFCFFRTVQLFSIGAGKNSV